MGGVSGRQTRFLLDGVDITEEHQGGTWIQTSVDALQEFSVQQNAYSAEFHGAGGTFNVVTKSGSNALRGSVFEFLRNDAFDAKNFFAQTKEKLERNQFGGTFGGPVVIPGLVDGRGRTFFFASYEGQRRKSGAVDVAIVPSPAQRQGNFQRPRADLRSADDRRQHARRRLRATRFRRTGSRPAAAVLHAVHPAAERSEQHLGQQPDRRVQPGPVHAARRSRTDRRGTSCSCASAGTRTTRIGRARFRRSARPSCGDRPTTSRAR